jgi:hypothetical protein
MSRADSGVVRRFEHCAAEAGHQTAFFHRYDKRALLNGSQNCFGIERFDKAGVDYAHVDAVGPQVSGCL